MISKSLLMNKKIEKYILDHWVILNFTFILMIFILNQNNINIYNKKRKNKFLNILTNNCSRF